MSRKSNERVLSDWFLFSLEARVGAPTLLRVRGAASAALIRGDSLGASPELREELLLENSLLALLKLEVRWRKDSMSSVGSLWPSHWGSWRCFSARSLDMTCDSGTPNARGVTSAWEMGGCNVHKSVQLRWECADLSLKLSWIFFKILHENKNCFC